LRTIHSTASCQISPAPASTIQARGVSSTSRRPLISTLSTSGLTSPVSTMLLPPPSTKRGAPCQSGPARSWAISASSVMRARRCARATMPKLLYGCRGTLCSTIMGELSHPAQVTSGEPMPSFDTVCEPNLPEVKNAVENTAKEIATRFDFKGTAAAVDLKDKEITMIGDAEFQLVQVEDILRAKLTKRSVDVRFLDKGDVQKMGGDKVKQVIKVKSGIESEQAKKITRIVKDSKLKVQAAIQGDAVRITGAKRDDLQAAMALIKKDVPDMPLSFNNFRD
jgi:uncharacterized protein YajQ (UPF0234 family)